MKCKTICAQDVPTSTFRNLKVYVTLIFIYSFVCVFCRHQLLFNYGLQEDENGNNGADADADANLIPQLVEKLAIPILHHQLAYCWDILSTRETKYAVSATNLVIGYVDLSSSALAELVGVLRDRLTNAVTDLVVMLLNSVTKSPFIYYSTHTYTPFVLIVQ